MNVINREPLANQTLIYDKDCPMCCIYTSAFVKAGVLDQNGRLPYSEAHIDNPEWDAERAKNEIALINYEKGTVTYGIDSMFTVISHRFTFLKPLFAFKPFHRFMKKVYSFISYNRKVIAPPPKQPAEVACLPDVNLKYRWLYIAFAGIISALMCALALNHVKPGTGLIAFGLILGVITVRFLIQSVVLISLDQKEHLMDYLGNLATINLELAAAVALIIYNINLLGETGWAFPSSLILTGILFNYIHLKRVKSIKVSRALCITWLIPWMLMALILIF